MIDTVYVTSPRGDVIIRERVEILPSFWGTLEACMLRAANWGLKEMAMGMLPNSPAVAGDWPPTSAPASENRVPVS